MQRTMVYEIIANVKENNHNLNAIYIENLTYGKKRQVRQIDIFNP